MDFLPPTAQLFRKAAESTMASSPECSGEGSTYRVITKLWRSYFHPPTDTGESGWYENRELPASKLLSEDPSQARQAGRRARSLHNAAWRAG